MRLIYLHLMAIIILASAIPCQASNDEQGDFAERKLLPQTPIWNLLQKAEPDPKHPRAIKVFSEEKVIT